MSIFVAGLDLGQAQDYTALVVNEVRGALHSLEDGSSKYEGLPITRIDMRHIERFPLRTKYQEIARLVEQRLRGIPTNPYLAVDKTGVGAGVLEMLAHLHPIAITITAGAEATRDEEEHGFHVPKRDLVSALAVPLQDGTLRIAASAPHAELLTKEMLAFRAKISAGGHDTYEAWREGDHDDLVLAAGIACWASRVIIEERAAGYLRRMRWISETDRWSRESKIGPG